MSSQTVLARFRPNVILHTKGHVMWVVIQHAFVKGLFAAKFLLAARMLGPEQFGLVGVALASLAIVESLSDTGMAQAIVQRKGGITADESGAVWTLQLLRGLVLFAVLYFFALPIAQLFGIANAAGLISFAALVPVLRNAINPGFIQLQRNRQFRALSISESVFALMDTAVTIVAITEGYGPISVLFGSLSAELLRVCASWLVFRTDTRPNMRWGTINDLARFGKWIWATSALTVLLNQFDKIIVARWLGATSFGLYQTGARLAQLGISDIAVALGQYLFPNMAALHHESPAGARGYLLRALQRMALISGILAAMLTLSTPLLVSWVLGNAWEGMSGVLQIQSLSMWFGALIAVCVAYLKAIGEPRAITRATLVQLVLLVLPAYWIISLWGAIGMASLVAFSLAVSLILMLKTSFSGDGKCE